MNFSWIIPSKDIQLILLGIAIPSLVPIAVISAYYSWELFKVGVLAASLPGINWSLMLTTLMFSSLASICLVCLVYSCRRVIKLVKEFIAQIYSDNAKKALWLIFIIAASVFAFCQTLFNNWTIFKEIIQ